MEVTIDCTREYGDCTGTVSEYQCNPANQTCINNRCVCNQGYTTLPDDSCTCGSNVICGNNIVLIILGSTCCPANYICENGVCACPTINTIENCTVMQGDCNSTTSEYQCDPSTQFCSGPDNKCLCNPGYTTLANNSCLCNSGVTCGTNVF